jgi:hypothetical protein
MARCARRTTSLMRFGLDDLTIYLFTVRVFGDHVVATAREADVILPLATIRGDFFARIGDAGIVAAIPLRHAADCIPTRHRWGTTGGTTSNALRGSKRFQINDMKFPSL